MKSHPRPDIERAERGRRRRLMGTQGLGFRVRKGTGRQGVRLRVPPEDVKREGREFLEGVCALEPETPLVVATSF